MKTNCNLLISFGDWGQHRPQALRAVSALSSMMVQYSKLVYGCQFSGGKGFVNPFLVVEIWSNSVALFLAHHVPKQKNPSGDICHKVCYPSTVIDVLLIIEVRMSKAIHLYLKHGGQVSCQIVSQRSHKRFYHVPHLTTTRFYHPPLLSYWWFLGFWNIKIIIFFYSSSWGK